MKIIRLSDIQKKCVKVDHPLLNGCKSISNEDFDAARKKMLYGGTEEIRQEGKDKIVLGYSHFVSILVGRFLANWPETQRFEEDMVSEGFVATLKVVNRLKIDTEISSFQGALWWAIRSEIEKMLNDSRAMFSASRSTNYRLADSGCEVEYNYAQNIREDLDMGRIDDELDWVDMLDDLESLSRQDRESFRSVILMCMSNDHGLEEEDLTEEEIQAINNVSKILGEI